MAFFLFAHNISYLFYLLQNIKKQHSRLLRAGATADSGDYDNRTALHICAAEGNLALVKMLAEEGGADLGVRDRWGFTPLDEAERVGAGPVVEFLRSKGAPSGSRSSSEVNGVEKRAGTTPATTTTAAP